MAEITQDGRTLKVSTPLPKDALLIERFKGREALSELFRFRVEMRAKKDQTVDPDAIITKGLTVTLAVKVDEDTENERFFHGMVHRFGRTGQDGEFAYYAAEVVPWLHLLTLTTDCRIFQDLSVPEIIEKVFKEWQGEYPLLVNFENKTDQSKYRKLDYCAQYRETDFAFVSRLMEQEGIFYYFKHEDGKHTLVLGDDPGDHVDCPVTANAEFRADEPDMPEDIPDAILLYVRRGTAALIRAAGDALKSVLKTVLAPIIAIIDGILGFIKFVTGGKVDVEKPIEQAIDAAINALLKAFGLDNQRAQFGVKSFRVEQELRPGLYTLRDYHMEMPGKTLQFREVTGLTVGDNDKLEIYDYPGAYAKRFNKPGARLDQLDGNNGEQQKLVRLGMQSEEAPHLVHRGLARQGVFTSGHKFNLTKHPDSKFNGTYVLTSVEHSALQTPPYESDDEQTRSEEVAAHGGPYRNNFTCIPHGAPAFRPPRITPKAVVQGPQTAVVVGRQGEEIDVDKFGRVKVQFHWDREGKKNENSSCFLRVAQLWAGKRWGASFWPRIGQEVIVAFLEGDPDQPIVVGSVYNAEQMPPYLGDGPDDNHKHDPKVSGIKSNSTKGGEGFNELRFDDTKDKEQVFVHAERNMDVRVKNDSLERILHHRHQIIGSERNGEKVGDQRELVHKDKHLNVLGDQIEKIEGNHELTIGHGENSAGGNLDLLVEGDRTETIGNNSQTHVKADCKEKVDGTLSLTIGGDQHAKIGMNHALEAGMAVHLKAGMNVVIEAGAQLSLKVGGNFIDINPGGVFIQGTMVMINSGGAAGSGPGASPAAPNDAKEAQPTRPDEADNAKTGSKSC